MLKKGKKVNYVDSNNYVASVNEDNFVLNSAFSQIPDKIRFFSKNFYTQKNGELQLENKAGSFFYIQKVDEETILLIADKTKFLTNIIDNGISRKVFFSNTWEEFLNTNIPLPQEIFYDHYIEFFEPINVSSIKNNIDLGSAFINREFIYQFFSTKYENLINDTLFDINFIPSIFNLLNDSRVDVRTEEENLNLSFGGFIPTNNIDGLFLSNKINDNIKEYFNLFADAYNNPETTLVKQAIFDSQNTLFLEKTKLELLSKTSFIPYPFYLDLRFTNLANEKNDFAHILTNFDNANLFLINSINDVNFINSTNANFVKTGNEEKKVKIFDLKEWLTTNTQIIENSDDRLEASKALQFTNITNYIKNNIKNKTRPFLDLLNKPAHSEILFYKIEKRQFENSPQPIQTFWVVPTETEIIKFIDTQIKYGTEYFYKIFAYTFILGNEYSYEEYPYNILEKQEDLANGRYKLKIKNKATYKVLEFEYSSFSGAIYETPLTKPIIKTILDQNSVRFVLEEPQNTSYEEFNAVEINETELFENIKKAQDNENNKTIYSISRNNKKTKLEIYRINNTPVSNLSFQGKKYKTLSLDTNQISFLESLIPNVKYYYMFRFLNEHNIPSNTSLTYEILLRNEDGFFSLETKTVDLLAPPKKNLTKAMKKYLLIRPSILQTQPNYPVGTENVDQITLGARQSGVWGEKPFKVRIKSKNTNRILEFNITSKFDRKKS